MKAGKHILRELDQTHSKTINTSSEFAKMPNYDPASAVLKPARSRAQTPGLTAGF
jgi:hypothetical protein